MVMGSSSSRDASHTQNMCILSRLKREGIESNTWSIIGELAWVLQKNKNLVCTCAGSIYKCFFYIGIYYICNLSFEITFEAHEEFLGQIPFMQITFISWVFNGNGRAETSIDAGNESYLELVLATSWNLSNYVRKWTLNQSHYQCSVGQVWHFCLLQLVISS